MTFKIIGSVLVVCCCTLLGIKSTGRTMQRIKSLRGLLSALDIMKSELNDMLTPMPELLKLLSEQVFRTGAEYVCRMLEQAS